ncbi:MAG TPA: helix-turn-helix transcriptional regulator [Flavisolibacter sp.]|jgi:AraC-like DNA-binding protein|nr:helix-turn-helix transcriptional regulator [Flavisolibacter sp.]
MAKASIPVYDICTIDGTSQRDLLIERLSPYLEKHYHDLHRPHRHSFFHLVLFTKGKGSHTIDFTRFPVKPFQIYFMVPGQVHSWHFEGRPEGYIVHFHEALFTSFLQNHQYLEQLPFFSGVSEDGVIQLQADIQEAVEQIFEKLLTELEASRPGSLDLIRIKLIELFLTVERSWGFQKKHTVPRQKMVLIRQFQKLIEKHFRTIRLPKEYAELLYITPNHLNALCQDLMGKTAGDLIRDRILLEAKRLLTNADMSIASIAYELNFQDNSYFNRFFKKYENMTPDEFRKSIL